jgi:glycine/D-amino acid oxidase-like deaminating enzyme
VTAPIVVNAAGPWARRLAAMAGIDLPVVRCAGILVFGLARRYRARSR